MMLSCLIVDDEPLAADVIESFVAKMPHLHLTGKVNSATEALSVLKSEKVDIMFLDIQMPEMTGLELLKTLRNPPIVIFTTAYPNYALESYEIDAADYLLKPIAFDRFVKALNKAEERLKSMNHVENGDTPDYIFVKADGKLVKINIPDICYVEGLKDYVIIHTPQSKVVTHNTMKNIEALLLTDENFIRIHRSYIINLRFVKEIEGNSFRVKDQLLTIGTTFKEDVQAKLEKFRFS
ncbi:MAG: LytTR family DNA-binding domain-containing protein [Flavobacteriales bacterium]|nr:LytTR family DNA-binding domain-containing protein [Flavobacteriales bacterium]